MEAFCFSRSSLYSPQGSSQRCRVVSHNLRCCSLLDRYRRRGFPSKPFCNQLREPDEKYHFFGPNFIVPQLKECKVRRNTIVRSEVAGIGSPSAYSCREFLLASKLRGICFYAVTGITAIFLFIIMLLAHPFVIWFDPYQRKLHHLVAKIWATMTIKPFFPIEIEGLKNLPAADHPAVFVSNHQSFLDIYSLLTLGRSFKFISKTGIFFIPVIGWAMYMLRLVPLKRVDSRSQLECLKCCIDLVRKGASVFFFPEGTRSKDGKLGSFKKGAFSVAVKTGVPVVPITLVGTGNIMPAGSEGIVNTGAVKVFIHGPLEGTDPDLLCNQARNVIADTLVHHAEVK